jgi:hypothetical protein
MIRSIDLLIGRRNYDKDPLCADEPAVKCAACEKVMKQYEGAIKITITPLDPNSKPAEDMLPLCADCVRDHDNTGRIVVRKLYPEADTMITEYDVIPNQ